MHQNPVSLDGSILKKEYIEKISYSQKGAVFQIITLIRSFLHRSIRMGSVLTKKCFEYVKSRNITYLKIRENFQIAYKIVRRFFQKKLQILQEQILPDAFSFIQEGVWLFRSEILVLKKTCEKYFEIAESEYHRISPYIWKELEARRGQCATFVQKRKIQTKECFQNFSGYFSPAFIRNAKITSVSSLGAIVFCVGVFSLQYSAVFFGNHNAHSASIVPIENIKQKETLQDLIDGSHEEATLDISGKSFSDQEVTIAKNLTIVGDEETFLKNISITLEDGKNGVFSNLHFFESKLVAKRGNIFSVKNCLFENGDIAISAKDSAFLEIENTYFEGFSNLAVVVDGVDEGRILTNTFRNNRNAISATKATLHIAGNNIQDTRDNAILLKEDKSFLYNNKIARVFYGAGIVFHSGVSKSQISGNIFYNMNLGIFGAEGVEVNDVKIYSNAFKSVSENNISVQHLPVENISHNDISPFVIEKLGCDMVKCEM